MIRIDTIAMLWTYYDAWSKSKCPHSQRHALRVKTYALVKSDRGDK